jgi:hypothetical protein
LTLAAQFGKTLLEEKEQLEYQIDVIKKDYQNKLEVCIIVKFFFFFKSDLFNL